MECNNLQPNLTHNTAFTPNTAPNVGQQQEGAQPQGEPVPPLGNALDLSSNPSAKNVQTYNTIRTPQGVIEPWTWHEYQPIQPGEPYMEKLADEAMNSKKVEIWLKNAQDNEELGDFKDTEKAYKKALKYTDKAEHYKLYGECLKKLSTSAKDEAKKRVYKEKAAKAFYYLGGLYEKQGASLEAYAAYKTSSELAVYELPLQALVAVARRLEDSREHASALEKLADFYAANGKIDLAIEMIEEAFELVKSFKILEKLAVLYGQAGGQESQSKSDKIRIRRFELQINEDPENIGLYRDYAWFLKGLGRQDEARAIKKRIDGLLQTMQYTIVRQKNRIQSLEQELEFLENRAIHLDFSHQTGMQDADLVPLLKKNPYIKLLNLERCTNITDAGLAPLKVMRWLTSLNLWGCRQITDKGLQYLKGLSQLKTLDLCGCEKLSDAGLQHLSGLTELTSLNLCECEELSDTGLTYLTGLTRLQSLNLSFCQITDVGLWYLAGLTQLTSLSLSECQVTDAGLWYLVDLTQLTSLDLQGCEKLTDGGLWYLAGLTQLKSLNLEGCEKLTDAGLKHLEELTQLSSLDLYSCYELSSNAKNQLKKKIPGLSINDE